MDRFLTEAMNSAIVPCHEYLLQGSILDNKVQLLLHRLRGLCDHAERDIETFTDHEKVYYLLAQSPVAIYVRRALDYPNNPWHVRYFGPEIAEKSKVALVRNCFDAATTPNVDRFLEELGLKLQYEYIAKGFLFTKGMLKITVFKVLRIHPENPSTTIPLSESHLVELTVMTAPGQDQVQDDMRNFADQLKPLVQMEVFDERRLH